MTKADFSEIAICVTGAVSLFVLLRREYQSHVITSHNSTFAATPRETVRRAIVLAAKIWVTSIFSTVDRTTLEDYKRFRSVVNLLLMLVAVNVFLVGVISVGFFMIYQQTGFESKIRTEDLTLILCFTLIFIFAYRVTDKLFEANIVRQPDSVLLGKVREQFSQIEAARYLQLQEDIMRKPINKTRATEEAISAFSQNKTIYRPLTQEEIEVLKKDPEAVKRDLISSGILDENGGLRDVYKRA